MPDRVGNLPGWFTMAGLALVFGVVGYLIYDEAVSRGSRSERGASPSIKMIVTAQADFRANDRDKNGVRDFWVADIGGLYRMRVDEPNPYMKLIEPSLACADARPRMALTSKGPVPVQGGAVAYEEVYGTAAPCNGYWYVALETYEASPDGYIPYDDGTGRNRDRFGLCCYPAKYGGKLTRTFIVNEDNVFYGKDTGGVPPRGFPLDPAKDGWTRMD